MSLNVFEDATEQKCATVAKRNKNSVQFQHRELQGVNKNVLQNVNRKIVLQVSI